MFFLSEQRYVYRKRIISNPLITAIIRVRNEEDIIADTLDHLSQFADNIVAYDDKSTDSTLKILKRHPNVVGVLHNKKWRSGGNKRLIEETRHRSNLLRFAKSLIPKSKWIFYADADERFVGDIRKTLENLQNTEVDAVKVRLFDAYMTREDCSDYTKGTKLLNFRSKFGPEFRDITMIWKNKDGIDFIGLDRREPTISNGFFIQKFYCQHYGKALSIRQWEETCDYYIENFYEKYGNKWKNRKGKAIHELSDFGSTLYTWGDELFANSVELKKLQK